MTDQFDKLFAGVDKMFDDVNKHIDKLAQTTDKMANGMGLHIATYSLGAKQMLKQAKETAQKHEQQAQALQAIRDSLIGKEGLMVEFTIWNPTGWQSFLEFFGLWKRRRVGMITKAPWENKMNFECQIEEPDGTKHEIHVLHLTVINPLDALARGV
jgi:hypothetical protein